LARRSRSLPLAACAALPCWLVSVLMGRGLAVRSRWREDRRGQGGNRKPQLSERSESERVRISAQRPLTDEAGLSANLNVLSKPASKTPTPAPGANQIPPLNFSRTRNALRSTCCYSGHAFAGIRSAARFGGRQGYRPGSYRQTRSNASGKGYMAFYGLSRQTSRRMGFHGGEGVGVGS